MRNPKHSNLKARDVAHLLFIDRINRGTNTKIPATPPGEPYNRATRDRLLRLGLIEVDQAENLTKVTPEGKQALAFWRFKLGLEE